MNGASMLLRDSDAGTINAHWPRWMGSEVSVISHIFLSFAPRPLYLTVTMFAIWVAWFSNWSLLYQVQILSLLT